MLDVIIKQLLNGMFLFFQQYLLDPFHFSLEYFTTARTTILSGERLQRLFLAMPWHEWCLPWPSGRLFIFHINNAYMIEYPSAKPDPPPLFSPP